MSKRTLIPNEIAVADYVEPEYLRKLQLSRLQEEVRLSFNNVPLFRSRMEERGLTPEDITCLEDIRKLPFTVKTDLRDTYPYGLLACPLRDVVRLHASSGTTGKPIVVAYTAEDIQNLLDTCDLASERDFEEETIQA